MKITIGLGENLGSPRWHIDFIVIGAGKVDDPHIITPPKYDNYAMVYYRGSFHLKIVDSKTYIEIRKYSLRSLTLINCSNITISNSNIGKVTLVNCSNILIMKDFIWKKIMLESCSNVEIIDSKIHIFDATKSEDLFASKCHFDRVKKRTYVCATIEKSKITGMKSFLPAYAISNF